MGVAYGGEEISRRGRGRQISPKILGMSSLSNRRPPAPSIVLAGGAFHPQPSQGSQGGQTAAQLAEERA
jgi:hypothetical protein